MSILSPFEILTNNGWKLGSTVTLEDQIACVLDNGDMEYRNVRQVFIYKSNFSSHLYNLNTFSLSICEGCKEPSINPCINDSVFQPFTTKESKEYSPIPTLVLSGLRTMLESTQIKAACKRIPLILEYGKVSRLTNVTEDFYPLGAVDKQVSSKSMAVSLSCHETQPTVCLIRLAQFDKSYKTICLPHVI